MSRSARNVLWVSGLLAAATVAAHAVAVEPVGAETCATCHPQAYAQWKRGPHALALERLSPSQRQDARCVSCHSPEQGAGLTGVQCESCHGGGRYYVPENVMRDPELSRLVGLTDPNEATCRRCHDASSPSLEPFHYEKKLERIRHWEAGHGK